MNLHRTEEVPQFSISEALESLPLLADDLYLKMQAMNLELVDASLEDLETKLWVEYMERERTPSLSATFVSALSQSVGVRSL